LKAIGLTELELYNLDKKINVFFSIFSNSDLDFIPQKNNRGLPSMMINKLVKFESNRAIRTWVTTWI